MRVGEVWRNWDNRAASDGVMGWIKESQPSLSCLTTNALYPSEISEYGHSATIEA